MPVLLRDMVRREPPERLTRGVLLLQGVAEEQRSGERELLGEGVMEGVMLGERERRGVGEAVLCSSRLGEACGEKEALGDPEPLKEGEGEERKVEGEGEAEALSEGEGEADSLREEEEEGDSALEAVAWRTPVGEREALGEREGEREAREVPEGLPLRVGEAVARAVPLPPPALAVGALRVALALPLREANGVGLRERLVEPEARGEAVARRAMEGEGVPVELARGVREREAGRSTPAPLPSRERLGDSASVTAGLPSEPAERESVGSEAFTTATAFQKPTLGEGAMRKSAASTAQRPLPSRKAKLSVVAPKLAPGAAWPGAPAARLSGSVRFTGTARDSTSGAAALRVYSRRRPPVGKGVRGDPAMQPDVVGMSSGLPPHALSEASSAGKRKRSSKWSIWGRWLESLWVGPRQNHGKQQRRASQICAESCKLAGVSEAPNLEGKYCRDNEAQLSSITKDSAHGIRPCCDDSHELGKEHPQHSSPATGTASDLGAGAPIGTLHPTWRM